MVKLEGNRLWRGTATPPIGAEAPEPAPRERYCAVCGQALTLTGAPIERFGEPFCSEAHAEAFVEAVRAARVQAIAATPPTSEGARSPEAWRPPARVSWKASVGRALCWGVPLLAVVFLLAGGGTALGAAGGFLPVLAALACPLGMFLMMRAMATMGDAKGRDAGHGK